MCCQPTRHFSISFPTCGLNHVRLLFASRGGIEVAVLGGGGGEEGQATRNCGFATNFLTSYHSFKVILQRER